MKECVVSQDGKEYDENTEFVSYSLQKKNGSRIVILQFVRGRGDEQFALVSLTQNSSNIFTITNNAQTAEKEYQGSYNIAMESDVKTTLEEEGVAYALNILPKDNLEAILHAFEGVNVVRAAGIVRALSIVCEPVKKLTGVEINPVELTLQVAERYTVKEAEGRGFCAIS
jgi:hypothetical protein